MAYVSSLQDIDGSQVGSAGGKGAQLGELTRIDGIRVPDGFVVTTDAFAAVLAAAPSVAARIDRLSALGPDDRNGIAERSAEIRRELEESAVPTDIAAAIDAQLRRLRGAGYAVRSSATAEDLPTASFAGQQDSSLNVAAADVPRHLARCWASLFTERAVTYRLRTGVDHRQVRMAVVVQLMAVPRAAGVLFTADPVSGHRKVTAIEAVPGLGEALVSGRAAADRYTVRDGTVVERAVATKRFAVHAAAGGGVAERAVDPADRDRPVLTDEQVTELARLGRRIEAHLGRPQDVEWCLDAADGGFQIVQSRPITTLFPLPEGADDGRYHLYLSVGHQQMMTDAWKPLGISMWQLTSRAPMRTAGGRLFVDATWILTEPGGARVAMISRGDPLTGDALRTILARDPVVPPEPGGAPATEPAVPDAVRPGADPEQAEPAANPSEAPAAGSEARPGAAAPNPHEAKPGEAKPGEANPREAKPGAEAADAKAGEAKPGGKAAGMLPADQAAVDELVERSRESIEAVRREIGTRTGPELFDFIRTDLAELHRVLFGGLPVIMAANDSAWWLNDKLQEWLGIRNAADTLSQSVPGNVTAEMGLALLDVADAIRPHPELVAFLRRAERDRDDGFLAALPELPGGRRARAAIGAFLDRYGMRCAGEIDITRPRWVERPSTLLAALLANVQGAEPGAGRRRYEQGLREAADCERDVLARLRALPGGAEKAAETKQMIDRVRTFTGFREYPKYAMVTRYLLYKRAMQREVGRLVDAGVLTEASDADFLTFDELRDAVATHRVDAALIRRRRADFAWYQQLTPPRVLTSDGEVVTGAYRRDDVPRGALAGIAVSAGTVEGRARVVLDMAAADLVAGDVLVTTFTDPSWVPVFVGIAGLVTEVGGLMTHGAVIAREYGLPAVVGVENATRLIRDGQRIRVHGTEGYVELLD